MEDRVLSDAQVRRLERSGVLGSFARCLSASARSLSAFLSIRRASLKHESERRFLGALETAPPPVHRAGPSVSRRVILDHSGGRARAHHPDRVNRRAGMQLITLPTVLLEGPISPMLATAGRALPEGRRLGSRAEVGRLAAQSRTSPRTGRGSSPATARAITGACQC